MCVGEGTLLSYVTHAVALRVMDRQNQPPRFSSFLTSSSQMLVSSSLSIVCIIVGNAGCSPPRARTHTHTNKTRATRTTDKGMYSDVVSEEAASGVVCVSVRGRKARRTELTELSSWTINFFCRNASQPNVQHAQSHLIHAYANEPWSRRCALAIRLLVPLISVSFPLNPTCPGFALARMQSLCSPRQF